MAPSARQIVRRAVGLAALAPGLALLVLAVILFLEGGFGGVLAGFVVAGIGVGLLLVALMMTHAPVTIAKLLSRTEERRDQEHAERAKGGRNGHDEGPDVQAEQDG